MRYFAQSEVTKAQAFFKKGKGRGIWSNAQVNLLYQNGIIGHLRGSYDGNFGAAGTYGLETLEAVGSDGRFILRDACEELTYYPRFDTKVGAARELRRHEPFRPDLPKPHRALGRPEFGGGGAGEDRRLGRRCAQGAARCDRSRHRILGYRGSDLAVITVIGRGHSGTRSISHTLYASGVYMGQTLNPSGDLVPAWLMYDACRVFARYVTWNGGLNWDFSRAHETEIPQRFITIFHRYIESVLNHKGKLKG